ncbi:MAG: hypothetical protein WBN57_01570 [Gammaproteobacteria bacterium]
MSALMLIFMLLAMFFMMYLDKQMKLQLVDEQDLVSRTSEWERKLASAEKLIAEQAAILSEVSSENRALFSKTGDLEKELLSSSQLIAEKEKLLSAVVTEAVIYEDVIKELRQSLLGEFNADLNKWNAELRDDLTFRFNEPRTLFAIGDATLTPKFKGILADFFPRYLKVITSNNFRNDIAEVRIEGHTSSVWGDLPPYGQEAYFKNMELSQNRSKNTLFYVTQLPEAERHQEWLRSKLTANGLSSSKLVDKNGYFITDPRSDGIENLRQSQRAEFRVRIDAESKITKIIDSGRGE